ncbi:pyrophosphate--fructose 6-phosphate 1-phosphotransferase subunit alpha-like isoform X2 [Phalaenopsis equestris]|uniref:pyrophosphate--fructose 6-phosphate 1-phosphotransferase subunit alpha-like isoform X2 n=1 Tax=Phalaenopsis equestris TaxID=78828 RepID=UPI0009E35418|nr:pyrophosphate--fructose 6-phosphate 1-phosphotransferase subunit alpha-like isoform X2 [Phalaenopsis equestris]
MRLEYGDGTTTIDPNNLHIISQAFPCTYGQPLAHFMRTTMKVSDAQIIAEHPILRVGVVFCGRPSPGGHNVVWGLHDAIKSHNPESVVLGFIGGFDLLGRTKDRIRTNEQINAVKVACEALKLNGLVIIGGVTSNTDAAHLAETFAKTKCQTKVVGVPVTLNGDLKNQFVETDVGFDTVCRVSSQLTSNICLDALSAGKYYHFIRVMGHNASHVALECALQSHPNMVILGEEVDNSKNSLFDIIKQISDAVQARSEQGKYHGVILIPEGLVEIIPELSALLQEIHDLQSQGVDTESISSHLSPSASALFEFLPPFIRKQFLLPPESDISAQLSQIETEKLIVQLVEAELNKRMFKSQKEGIYKGKKFSPICHFFGYQTRGSLPSKFDCDYAYVLGHICYHIVAAGLNGYMATATNLKHSVEKWRCGAVPIIAMMTMKQCSNGTSLYPAVVDLEGKLYEKLKQNASSFLMDDLYRDPGPLQFDGPGTDVKSLTLCLED